MLALYLSFCLVLVGAMGAVCMFAIRSVSEANNDIRKHVNAELKLIQGSVDPISAARQMQDALEDTTLGTPTPYRRRQLVGSSRVDMHGI